MSKIKKIALFGGSFDPIHNGHIELIKKSYQTFSLDKIILLPCKQSPHKPGGAQAASLDRYEMCKIATHDLPFVDVSDFEITSKEIASYSWMTVKHYKTKLKNTELHWILGTDQWKKIETWSRHEYLRDNLKFLIINRQDRLIEKSGYKYDFLEFDSKISSTEIRKTLTTSHKCDLIPPSVLDYINSKNLYFRTSKG